jgi:hypothetical protein
VKRQVGYLPDTVGFYDNVRRIIMVPSQQHLLGFLTPLFESHRRLVSYAGDRSSGEHYSFSQTASRNILI